MNGVTVDAAVCVDVIPSMAVVDVEGISLMLGVEVSFKVVVGVGAISVLTVEVSIGRIISTTNFSVSLFTPKSVKVVGTLLGIPNILT